MMSIPRRAAVLGALLLVVLGTSCTLEQQAAWAKMSPLERENYVAHVEGRAPRGSVDCYQAIDRHWPASSREWARDIVWRESRNKPSAANPSSAARGCWQLMMTVHSGRFTKLGYSPSQWSDPDVNTLVALDLYRAAGTSPWAM